MGMKHTHKYIKIDGKMWRCAIPECGWFIHRGLEGMLINRQAVCWGCELMFTMDIFNLSQEKPTCMGCMSSEPPASATVKLNSTSTIQPLITLEQIEAQYKIYKGIVGVDNADMWKEGKLKELEEQQRAQSTNTVEDTEDQIEDEYIPPKYDVE
jgi:hypothetical protein